MPLPDPVRQKIARETLAQVFRNPGSVYAVHYACQHLHAGDGTSSPRIGAIAMRCLGTGQVETFSIDIVAERNGLSTAEIQTRLDEIETKMLQGFYAFVKATRGIKLVHWNMRDHTFGFSALEHRLIVLGGAPEMIDERDRVDLATLMADLYGAGYTKERNRLAGLADANDLKSQQFLGGADEAAALNGARYRDVTASTLAKVRVIAEVAQLALAGNLKTDASLLARRAGPVRLFVKKITDNPLPSLLAACGSGAVLFFKLADYLGF